VISAESRGGARTLPLFCRKKKGRGKGEKKKRDGFWQFFANQKEENPKEDRVRLKKGEGGGRSDREMKKGIGCSLARKREKSSSTEFSDRKKESRSLQLLEKRGKKVKKNFVPKEKRENVLFLSIKGKDQKINHRGRKIAKAVSAFSRAGRSEMSIRGGGKKGKGGQKRPPDFLFFAVGKKKRKGGPGIYQHKRPRKKKKNFSVAERGRSRVWGGKEVRPTHYIRDEKGNRFLGLHQRRGEKE